MTVALMVAGTSSGAGKSALASALLRLASDRGIRCAPFKAQNMSLNSHVTPLGEEMGRSQATQAAAARVLADARMNPLLLKPSGEGRSQVILRGKAMGHMSASECMAFASRAFPAALEAYRSLAAEYDLIVLEGAGSAAEINLWDRDIVNMPMAEAVGAKVLLVADVERGGALAGLFGTLSLFPGKWRDRTMGFVLNRFRGDVSLIKDGVAMLEEKTSKTCYGVLPYFPAMGLPEEDSLGAMAPRKAWVGQGRIKLAVVRLRWISNFTDFEPLNREGKDDVELDFVPPSGDFSGYDAVILPGSKNTAADLDDLRRCGFDRTLRKFPGTILGICGGMQMLGRRILDPLRVEGKEESQGFGLLPIDTDMFPEKVLQRTQGIDPFYGQAIRGYEIHHGRSVADGAPLLIGQPHCFGTYLHGLFDMDGFRHAFLRDIYLRKTGNIHIFLGRYDLENDLDAFAAHVGKHLDFDRLFQNTGI